jgi:hypothetical protein
MQKREDVKSKYIGIDPFVTNLLEAISKLGFLVEISRQRSAGQEREAEDQPVPPVDGISDTHTQVCRGLETMAQRRYRTKRLF